MRRTVPFWPYLLSMVVARDVRLERVMLSWALPRRSQANVPTSARTNELAF